MCGYRANQWHHGEIYVTKVRVFKSNQMFGTKHSKTNWFQKTVKYKRNKQIVKYSNWNIKLGKIGKIAIWSFCFYMFPPN